MNLPRPTALGVKFLLFWLLLVAAFLATPYSNLFFLLLTFLTLLGALSFGWTARTLGWTARTGRGGITWHLDIPATAAGVGAIPATAAGVGASMRVAAEGAGALRAPRLRVVFEGPGGTRGVAFDQLPPLGRGIYRVSRAALESVWPTGLFRLSVPLRAPADFVVYPLPADQSRTGGAAGRDADLAGDLDGGLQPSGLREFRDGDDPRRIHWKASARRGAFVVQEWAGAAAAGREAVLDRRRDAESLEQALALLTALVLEARASKEPLTIHTQGLAATFGDTHRPWEECLRFLASAQCLPLSAPPPPPTSPGTRRL